MGTERVERFIKENNIEAELRVLGQESTKNSELAAKAVGCTIAEIAKSIAFYYEKGGGKYAVIVVLSGDKKVDEEKLMNFLGAREVERMSPDDVKNETGYAIGGVPPFPHSEKIKVVIDKSLFRFRRVWAAAGAPNAVMKISPEMLANKLRLRICDVSK